jgi:hypothetical protein
MSIFRSITLSLTLGVLVASLHAAELASLSNQETASGINAAIARGAEFAVDQLGKKDGFMGNPKVRIGLPDSLQKVEKAARMLGFTKQTDELVEAMNRAAEAAVAQAKPVLVGAIKNMSVTDAKDILLGPNDAATQYFKRTTSAELSTRFRPIVKSATAQVALGDKYNALAGKAAQFGLIDAQDADLDSYVTHKAMDGLFMMIAEQEKKIRADPIGTGSALLKRVFGAAR